jgi:hypothetical protein
MIAEDTGQNAADSAGSEPVYPISTVTQYLGHAPNLQDSQWASSRQSSGTFDVIHYFSTAASARPGFYASVCPENALLSNRMRRFAKSKSNSRLYLFDTTVGF